MAHNEFDGAHRTKGCDYTLYVCCTFLPRSAGVRHQTLAHVRRVSAGGLPSTGYSSSAGCLPDQEDTNISTYPKGRDPTPTDLKDKQADTSGTLACVAIAY
jgi:hypothetical protein